MRIPFTLKERDYIMSEDFPWYLGLHTSDPTTPTTIQLPDSKEVPMLTHQIYNRGKEHNTTLAPSILEQIKEVTNYKKILRVKFNLLLQQEFPVVHPPHVDWDIPHKVFLHYVCGDGCTILYKQKWQGFPTTDLTKDMEIHPIENTGVFFNGETFHASTSPVKEPRRIVMNVDYE
mgnify:FL=1